MMDVTLAKKDQSVLSLIQSYAAPHSLGPTFYSHTLARKWPAWHALLAISRRVYPIPYEWAYQIERYNGTKLTTDLGQCHQNSHWTEPSF